MCRQFYSSPNTTAHPTISLSNNYLSYSLRSLYTSITSPSTAPTLHLMSMWLGSASHCWCWLLHQLITFQHHPHHHQHQVPLHPWAFLPPPLLLHLSTIQQCTQAACLPEALPALLPPPPHLLLESSTSLLVNTCTDTLFVSTLFWSLYSMNMKVPFSTHTPMGFLSQESMRALGDPWSGSVQTALSSCWWEAWDEWWWQVFQHRVPWWWSSLAPT